MLYEVITLPDGESFFSDIDRRAAGLPVAYIVGSREFWGLPFTVTPAVLIPKNDTDRITSYNVCYTKLLRYHTNIMITALIYVILALGLNIVVGLGGLLNLGYAAFFAVGAS